MRPNQCCAGTYFENGYVDESADVVKQLSSFFGGNKKNDKDQR